MGILLGEVADLEFLIKIIAEAGIVGGIAITVIRFLMTRLVKQLDDAEQARRSDHHQLLQWFAGFSRTMLVWEKQFLLHDATVHGINPAAGSTHEERMSAAERKFDSLQADFDQAIARLDQAIGTLDYEVRKPPR